MFRTGAVVALRRLLREWFPPREESAFTPIGVLAPDETPPAPAVEGDVAELTPPFARFGEGLWLAALPAAFRHVPGDSQAWPSRSRVTLLEDGRPMPGPPHTEFAHIPGTPGAYIHWHDGLYFAGSDASDPNGAGRRYAVRLEPRVPRMVAFGSCHAGLLMRSAARRGWSDHLNHNALTYNTEDTLQLVRQLKGDLVLPDRLDGYLASAPTLVGALDGIEAMLLEISNRTVIRYDGLSLNRVAISDRIVVRAGAISPEMLSVALHWFDHGVNRCQEDTRAETAAVLLRHMPDVTPEDALARDIVARARGEAQTIEQVEAGIAALLDQIPVPTTLMLHTLRYMPDGRPLRWPAGFHRQLKDIGGRLGIPVLDPASMVEARGPAETLADDLEHYSPRFVDDLAEEALRLLNLRPDA